MSIDWRIKVYDETGTSRTQPGVANNIITSDMGVASLDTFDVDAAGGCLEASFRAVPAFVDIQPRDVITLEITTNAGALWTEVYRGYVVTCGNPRSRSIQPYKLVGLKQRFYEKLVYDRVEESDDVAAMVQEVFDDIAFDNDMPSGVSTATEDITTLNFVVGDRFPQLETAGDFFDALAEATGSFVVPSGSTYTYDSQTYGEGDTVPSVLWGVRANGQFFFCRPVPRTFFFQRPLALSVAISEDDPSTLVEYNQITAESVVDDVVLVYATQMEVSFFTSLTYNYGAAPGNLPSSSITVQPLSRRFSFGGDKSTLRHVVQSPLTLTTDVASTATSTVGSVTNIANVLDGNDATFAEIGGTLSNITIGNSSGLGTSGFIIRLRIETTNATNYVSVSASAWSWKTSDLETGVIYDVYLSALPPADVVSAFPTFWTLTAQQVKVYTCELLVPDVDDGGKLSEEYASGFVRQSSVDVANIRRVDTFGVVTPTLNYTPDGESTRDVPVERISYALTTNDGFTTTYHLGQAYDAELLSERAVLEALAKRATR